MKKKRKNKGTKKQWFPKPTKKKVMDAAKNVALDGLVITSSGFVAAGLGKWSLALGGVLLLAGNYVEKDISKYLRLAGASAIIYGVAKGRENEIVENEAAINGVGFVAIKEGAKNRLINFKNDWLKALHIDRLIESKSNGSGGEGIGSIDLSAMDAIEDAVKDSALKFEMRQMQEAEKAHFLDTSDQDDSLESINGIYAEEAFDLSTI